MTDLIEFLNARLDEDEAEHIVRHDPERALRQITAIRELIRHLSVGAPGRPLQLEVDDKLRTPLFPEWLLQPFAAIWSDHPDYRQEWKTREPAA